MRLNWLKDEPAIKFFCRYTPVGKTAKKVIGERERDVAFYVFLIFFIFQEKLPAPFLSEIMKRAPVK